MSDDKKIIFSMRGLSKSFNNNNKQVLKNIHLSFFYGAKIGIIGLNGSGKSTLLKIIAGVEKSFQGDVTFSDGYNVGYLEQEPKLDESKTVIEIVKEGMQEAVDALADYNAINDAFGLPENYEDADKMEKLMKEQGVLQDKIEALAGVLEVDIGGNREEMIEITVDPLILETYNIVVEALYSFLQRNNQLIAAGSFEGGRGRFIIKTESTAFDNGCGHKQNQ